MPAAYRSSSIERYLGAAALFVGRGVARGTSLLPRLVRRASGLEHPSPEATLAAIVRGVTTLAPMTVGGVGGAAIDLAGAAGVLALASWTVCADTETGARATLVDAIEDAERRALCSEHAAAIWRVMVGVASVDGGLVAHEGTALRRAAAKSVSLGSVARLLGRAAVERFPPPIGGLTVALRAGLRGLDVGRTLSGTWIAMGEAARLVDAMQSFASRRATEPDGEGVVIRLAPRAA